MLTDDLEHSRLQDLEVARLRKDLEVMRADGRDSAAVLAQVRKLERAERSADRLSTRFVKRHGLAKLFEYRLAVGLGVRKFTRETASEFADRLVEVISDVLMDPDVRRTLGDRILEAGRS
jgi:hypothetical protein